jgi:hypothetical protein
MKEYFGEGCEDVEERLSTGDRRALRLRPRGFVAEIESKLPAEASRAPGLPQQRQACARSRVEARTWVPGTRPARAVGRGVSRCRDGRPRAPQPIGALGMPL